MSEVRNLANEVVVSYVLGYTAGALDRREQHDSTWRPNGARSTFEAGYNDGYNGEPPRVIEHLERHGKVVIERDSVPAWFEPIPPVDFYEGDPSDEPLYRRLSPESEKL